MEFTVFLIAIAFIVAIVYNSNKSNKKSTSSTSPRRITIDNVQSIKTAKTKPNKTVFYGKFKKQIVNCEPQNENLRCDIVLNIDVDAQTVSCIEIGFMKKFKSVKRRFNAQTKFVELSEIGTNETYYLQLHTKNNHLYSVELTNSNDTGFIYFDESIF